MHYEPNYEQRQAIESAADSFIEQMMWNFREGEVNSIDQAREAVYECDWNECAAIGLSMDDEVDLIQQFGPDYDLDLGEVSVDDLRGKLEGLTVAVIHYAAEQEVAEWIGELEEIIEDNDLEFETLTDSNRYGSFVHRAEREPAPNCTVYEYRCIEDPDQAVDVWEIRFDKYDNLYFEVDVSEE